MTPQETSDAISTMLMQHAYRQEIIANIYFALTALAILALLIRWWKTPNS